MDIMEFEDKVVLTMSLEEAGELLFICGKGTEKMEDYGWKVTGAFFDYFTTSGFWATQFTNEQRNAIQESRAKVNEYFDGTIQLRKNM